MRSNKKLFKKTNPLTSISQSTQSIHCKYVYLFFVSNIKQIAKNTILS